MLTVFQIQAVACDKMHHGQDPDPPPPWSDLSLEVWVHIWSYLESTTLWTCRQVCLSWNRTIAATASRLNFDATCLDMSHWPDYFDSLERARVSPEACHMFASVQHLKLCCGSTTRLGHSELVAPLWMGQFMTLYTLPELMCVTLDCHCAYRGRAGASLVGVGWRELKPSFKGCLLMFPAPWLTDPVRLAIRECNIAIATCPDSLHFAPYSQQPRIALCQPATTVRQLCRWMDHLPALKSLSLRESPMSYNFNRAMGMLANALLPLVLQGVNPRRLYRLDVLRVHLHGGDGEKLWTPMHNLLTMIKDYPLFAWHPTIQDLGPVLRDHPLRVEVVLSAAPPREHDWTEMSARAVAIYQTMRPDSVTWPPDWSTLKRAAVLTPGDEASLCPLVNNNTVTVARKIVEDQDIVQDRVQALQRRHEYIYGPAPRVIVAALGMLGDHLVDSEEEEFARMLEEDHESYSPPTASTPSPESFSPPTASTPSPESSSNILFSSPPPPPAASPSPPSRSDSSSPEPGDVANTLGEASAFCYPSLVEFTHWQMMQEVQQLMERFKAHLNNNCDHVELERPLVMCQGVCPVTAATWVPEQGTTTILPPIDQVLLNRLRQELRTEPCGYQLAVFQTQSPVDPPSFLCHCRPPPPPP